MTIVKRPRFKKDCIRHKWTTNVIMGVPFMVCTRCGRTLPKAVKEDTITDQEIREMGKRKRDVPKDWKEIVERIWERKHG